MPPAGKDLYRGERQSAAAIELQIEGHQPKLGRNHDGPNGGSKNMKTGTFFEINVSYKGHGLFATDSSIRSYSSSHVAKLVKLFKEKFPKDEGYRVTVTCWHTGCPAMPEEIKKELED